MKQNFLTLESTNYINKQIPQLVRNDATTIYNQFEILNETKCYYENLYSKREHFLDTNDIIEQLSVDNFPKLDEKEFQFLEGSISENEVLAFLKKMKNDKGSDQMVLRVNSLNISGMNQEVL